MLKEAPSVFHASDGAAYERWLGRWSSRLANAFLDFVKFPSVDLNHGALGFAFTLGGAWRSFQAQA